VALVRFETGEESKDSMEKPPEEPTEAAEVAGKSATRSSMSMEPDCGENGGERGLRYRPRWLLPRRRRPRFSLDADGEGKALSPAALAANAGEEM